MNNNKKAKRSGLAKQLSPLLAWEWSVVGVVSSLRSRAVAAVAKLRRAVVQR